MFPALLCLRVLHGNGTSQQGHDGSPGVTIIAARRGCMSQHTETAVYLGTLACKGASCPFVASAVRFKQCIELPWPRLQRLCSWVSLLAGASCCTLGF